MGMKSPRLGRDSQAGEPLSDMTLHLDHGVRAAFHSKPHRARGPVRRKHAASTEDHREGLDVDRLSHPLNDTITARRIDLADKHERQMQVSRRDPFQRGSAGRVERDPETSLLFRDGRPRGVIQLDSDKQTHNAEVGDLVNW
jgi:hypothetical protein